MLLQDDSKKHPNRRLGPLSVRFTQKIEKSVRRRRFKLKKVKLKAVLSGAESTVAHEGLRLTKNGDRLILFERVLLEKEPAAREKLTRGRVWPRRALFWCYFYRLYSIRRSVDANAVGSDIALRLARIARLMVSGQYAFAAISDRIFVTP